MKTFIAGLTCRGVSIEVVQLEGRSPLLFVDVPATAGATDKPTVLMYGHLDKQPPCRRLVRGASTRGRR